MKKFILFILIAIVVTTSYGFFNFDEKNDKKEVTSAFENYINAAQNEDVKTIHEYHIIWRNVWRTSQESYKIHHRVRISIIQITSLCRISKRKRCTGMC